MAVNSTAENSKTLLEPVTLAAKLSAAPSRIPEPPPALTRFFNRFLGKPNAQPARLPSGLEPDEAAALASALAAAIRDSSGPVTAATFQAENIQVQPAPTGWQVILAGATVSGPALDKTAQQAAFTNLLYKMVSGNCLPGDMSGKTAQLSQLASHNPELAKVFSDGLGGRFTSTDALAGGFGWSLYRKTHLNFPVLSSTTGEKATAGPAAPKSSKAGIIPEETTLKPAKGKSWGGPLALVSLVVALVLLAGTILLSVNGLDKDYRQQSEVLPTSTPFPTPVPPTPTPAVALQTTKQADGATVTRYNAALDETAGNGLTDPSKLTAGQVVSFNGYTAMQIQSVHWSDDGSKVNLALKNGGWETWDVASKQRLSRKELPDTEQYSAVSWSPDGQNFAAVGLDGQLRLGKADRIQKTVNLNLGPTAGTFSTYPWPFSWSPNSSYLLLVAPGSNIQLWNFQNTPTQISSTQSAANGTMNMRGDNLAGTIEWSGDSRFLARLTPGDQSEQIDVYNPFNLARLYTMTVVDTPSGVNNPQTGQNTGLETISNGFSWSQDGKYIALIRGFKLDSSGTANNYIDSNEGDLVTVLEVPDMARLTTRTTQAQPIPNAQGPNTSSVTATPGGRRTTGQTGTSSLTTVSPVHLQTLTLTGMGDANTAGGRNLVWSKSDRLLVLGTNVTTANGVQNYQYKAQTLDLTTNNDSWKWQAGDIFDLPFDSPHNLVAWSPDNARILYNTTLDQVGLGTVPDGSQKMATDILSQGTSEFYLDYYPSPDGHTYLQSSYNDGKYTLQIKDVTNNKVISEPAQPDGAMPTLLNAAWSADGKLLAIPFLVTNNPSGTGEAQVQEVIRTWRVGDDQKVTNIGDLLVGTTPNNYFAYPQTVSWDNTEGTQAVLFENMDGKIGRWDVNRQIPSLADQHSSISNLTSGNYDPAATINFPYYDITGQVPGLLSDGGTGSWVWLPDHKRVIYCASNCYIQALVAPGVTSTTGQSLGIKFDPAPLNSGSGRVNSNLNLKVSPDGRMVAVALSSGLVNLYDSTTGKLFNSFTAHQGSINSLNFSPDGKYLVTTGADRAVKVWDTTTWRNLSILRLIEPSTNASQVQWLPDNKTLALASSGGNTLLWRALP